MRVLSLLLICTLVVRSKIIIEDANIAALSYDDIGMIFYVAIRNADNCAYSILTRMVKCVEEIESADKDCELMNLIGGDMGTIKPHCAKNITLVYPNMYLLNRKGYCVITIKFISEDNQLLEKKTNITFDTYLKGTKWPFTFSAVDTKRKVSMCESIDQDPLRNCRPVDCHMKYLGTRSYYNKKWKRCQKVPKCIYDADKELPDVGYSPITNKCLDLEKCIRRNELVPLENKHYELKDLNKYSMILTTINCHHGKQDNNTGMCECDPGWGSAPFEPIPSLFTFHMCNVEQSSWYESNKSMITFIAFFISITSVLIAMIVVIISFILYYLYRCLRKKDEKKKEKAQHTDPEGNPKTILKKGTSESASSNQSSGAASNPAASDTHKSIFMVTEVSRGKSGEGSDNTVSSDFSKASKESSRISKSLGESGVSKTTSRSLSLSKSGGSTILLGSSDKKSRESLRIGSSHGTSLSSSTKVK